MTLTPISIGSLFWTEAGSGDPIVFVHGIPTDYRAWSAQFAALSPRFRTIALSRRYAFPNERNGDVRDSTVEANCTDLEEFLQAIELPPVHLVGHSYGGFVAALFAVEHPGRLRSLTLVEPAIASLLLRDPKSRAEAFGLLVRAPKVALAAARFLRTSAAPAIRALDAGDSMAAVRLNLAGIEDRTDAFDTFPGSVQQMFVANARTIRETDLPYPTLGSGDLARVATRTLVVNGTTSALWLREIGARTARAIPHARHVQISASGHLPHLQNPAEFNQALASFLSSAS
jgi:pimeloyl-ACP methyl ester carboxylesterase